jgi:uncharacterized phage protein gp47/JayE
VSTPSYQPPPDMSAYVDLRIYDRTDQEIFDGALAALKSNMPGWVPREGHTEVLLLEAVALEGAEFIVAANRLPGAVLEALLQLFGVFKDYGAAPTVTATVKVADTVGHTIPAGTRMYLTTVDGTGVVTMLVEPPGLTIPAGSSQGSISLIGDVFTDSVNGAPAGTGLVLASPMSYVDSITLNESVADGRDAETDEAWRDRGVQTLARLTSTLVTPRQFVAAALTRPEVSRAVAVDNTDPTSGAGVGNSPGHITVAVLGDGGASLSAMAKGDVEEMLEDQAIAQLDVHVTDIAIQTVTMTVVVTQSDASLDPAFVLANVEGAIMAYLDPMTWQFGLKIYRNELISLVDQVEGVGRVVSVAITGADGNGDLTLATASTVPRATAVSITSSISGAV